MNSKKNNVVLTGTKKDALKDAKIVTTDVELQCTLKINH